MTFTRFNTAEGGSNTTTVTAANSGAGSGYAFDTLSGSPAYSSTVAQSGTLSYYYPTGGYLQWNLPSLASTVWVRSWVYFTALPASNASIHLPATSGGPAPNIQLTTAGKLRAYAQAGSDTQGTYTYVINTWYRVETQLAFTGNGQATVKTYDNSGTLLETVTSPVATTAWVSLTSVQFSALGTASTYQDNLAISTAGWIGSRTSFSYWTQNTAEGGTSTTTLTVANSGGASGDAINAITGTLTFDSTNVRTGLLAYKAAAASGYATWNLPGTATVIYLRAYVYFTALTATQSTPFQVAGDAGAHIAQFYCTPASGHWLVSINGGTGATGTTTPVISTWYRVEMQVTFGTGTAQTAARIYSAEGVLLETITSTANGTLTVPQYARWGQLSAYTPAFWLDNPAVSDQGWIGTATSTKPGLLSVM
jgi:hypothetical protein